MNVPSLNLEAPEIPEEQYHRRRLNVYGIDAYISNPLNMGSQAQGNDKTLLTDGYIARSFQSGPAEQYFCNLLKTYSLPPQVPLIFPDREGIFFTVEPPHFFVPLGYDPGRPQLQLLDRSVSSEGGPVVPQIMWSLRSRIPDTTGEYGDRPAELHPPIFFECLDGKLGLPLEAAIIPGQCKTLRNALAYAPLGAWSKAYVRITWPGYQRFKRQICIRDPADNPLTVTVATFAHRVGRSIDAFLRDCKPDPKSPLSDRQLWQIGDGGTQRSDIVIIGVVNDSVGSWMPILQLTQRPYDTLRDVKNRMINWEAIFKLMS
ncbi:hypothetical protein BJV74DRAFT_929102 [Russula compacta]|nr:hypothetical protein BJV74DRAFT_929102 [Russula compacta]